MGWAARRAAAAFVAAWPAAALGADAAALESLRLAARAERIAKLHAQAAHGISPERTRRALAEAVREFQDALASPARSSAAEARDNHTLLTILWGEYRAWALKPATLEGARKLADRADEVAWVAAKPARDSRPGASAAARAARAGGLAQRLARQHLLRPAGARHDEAAREIEARSAELAELLEALAALPANTPEIAAEVQAARTQFAFLTRAAQQMRGAKAAAPHLENVAKTGDHILESMERAARLYEAAGL